MHFTLYFGVCLAETSGTPTSAVPTTAPSTATAPPTVGGLRKYQALYQFDARNADELSFMPGDTIWVSQSDCAGLFINVSFLENKFDEKLSIIITFNQCSIRAVPMCLAKWAVLTFMGNTSW